MNRNRTRAASRHALTSSRRRYLRAAQPALEQLESRLLLTVTFAPQFGIQATNNGGTTLSNNTPVYLIFANGQTTGYGFDGSVTQNDIITAVNKILASSFLSAITEYGAT